MNDNTPKPKRQRTDAHRRADSRYDEKRTDKPVSARFEPHEIERIDAARGDQSRAQFVRDCVLDKLHK